MKKIKLTQDKETLVDDDVYEEVNKYKWHVFWNGYKWYATRTIYINPKKKKLCYMHRYIYELKYGTIPEKMQIDHIDGDGLNNLNKNMRLATNSQNGANKGKLNIVNSSSIYKAVGS